MIRLPRLVQITDPSQTKIKPPFTDLHAWRRHLLDKPLLTMYASLQLPSNAHLVLLTWVIADGWGDLIAQQEAYKILSSHFPDLQITQITFIHHTRTPPFQPPHILRYTGKINHPIIYEHPSQELLNALSRADLIFEIPTQFPHLHEICPNTRHEHLGENSLIETPRYFPMALRRCMGLHPLEKGIFIKPPLPAVKQHPHAFQLCYIKHPSGLHRYLSTLFSTLKEDPRTIEVVLFHLPSLLHVLHTIYRCQTPDERWARWNIKEIFLYQNSCQTTIPLHPTGKSVRLVCVDSLSPDEMRTLMGQTEHLIGVTGDQSVLEAIGARKPFLYAPPPFKRGFLRDLIHIAERNVPQLTQFLRLSLRNPTLPTFDDEQGWVCEEYIEAQDAYLRLSNDSDEAIADSLAELVRDPLLQSGFTQLAEYLSAHHAVDPILSGLVARGILQARYPDIAQEEALFCRPWLHPGSLSDAITPSN